MGDVELKPCPFCGAQMIERNGLIVHEDGLDRESACILSGWGFPVIHTRWGTDERKRWNTRAPSSFEIDRQCRREIEGRQDV